MKKIITLAIAVLGLFHTYGVAQTVTDIDGNTYQTVTVGAQEWTAENLRVTKYRNGDPILANQNSEGWAYGAEGIWANYSNDPANDALYGKLYNWYATVDERGLCPDGWRVPTDDDWQQLAFFVDANAWGNNNSAGTKLKSRRQVDSPLGGEFNTTEHPRWDSHSNRSGTDNFGFNALPAGTYSPSNGFTNIGKWAYFASITQSDNNHIWVRTMLNSHRGMSRSLYPKTAGFSVRCIKGETVTQQVPQLITLAPSNVTMSSAILGGFVGVDGGSSVTDRGVVWANAENPTVDNNSGMMSIGSGLGAFTETISGLNTGDILWVRAYATNAAGTAYGIQKRLNVPTTVDLPVLTTKTVANITSTSAISGGEITSIGGALITSRGVVWSTSSNPTTDNNEGITSDGDGDGVYSSTLSGLSPETEYYVRAYATNSEGTAYGDEKTFFTTLNSILYNLSITVSPDGYGTATGAGAYEAGASVSLVATPETGYQFVSWTLGGDEVSTNASYTYTMPEADVALVANFEEIPVATYELTLSVSPASSGTATGAGSYEAGASVSLVATPEAGYQFVNWTLGGNEVSTNASYTYTMPESDVALVANFEEIPATTYELTLSVNPASSGTATGAGAYEAGVSVSLVATPEAGYQFVSWTLGGNEVSTNASYTYTMPESDVALVANFEEIPVTTYELTLSVNPASSGTATGAGTYEAGASVSLVATPEAGYQFVSWTLGGDEVSTNASYTYTMPESNVALVANFEEQTPVEDGDPCPDSPTVTDVDGNVYNTVYIGGQCWIAENLKVTHYANGDEIVKDTDWNAATTGVYGVYPFASITGFTSEQEVLNAYGAHYNWYAVGDNRGICPVGWRVASFSDWETLLGYISGIDANGVGNQLKSCRQPGHPDGGSCDTSEHPRWNFNASNRGDNRYGFGGLPAGYRDQSASFQLVGTVEMWWTSTEDDETRAHYIGIKVNGPDVESIYVNPKNYGSSVRCIKE